MASFRSPTTANRRAAAKHAASIATKVAITD